MDEVYIGVLDIAFMFVTLFLSIGFPLFLWIYFARKKVGVSSVVICGALGFFVPQILIRLPIISVLALSEKWVELNQDNMLLSIAAFAFTAALFETVGRLVVFKTLLKNKINYNGGVAAGIGHGGIESIMLVGMTYINNIVFSFMINLDFLPDIDGIREAVDIIMNTPTELFLIAGFERVFTIMFHIAMSVLLCLFISKGKTFLGFLICMGLHFALDFVIPLMSVNNISIYIIEGILLIIAVVCSLWIKYIKRKFKEVEIEKDPAEKALEEGY